MNHHDGRPIEPDLSDTSDPRNLVMMRRCFLVFGLLAIACLLGTSTAQGCGGCWVVYPSYYVVTPTYYAVSPCYYYHCVPTSCWSCCDPCCGWSCCHSSYPAYRYSYSSVVPSQAGTGCASCGPVVNSRSGSSLAPIPEKGTAPSNR